MARSRRRAIGFGACVLALTFALSCGNSGTVTKFSDTYRNKETVAPATTLEIVVNIPASGVTFPGVVGGSWAPVVPVITPQGGGRYTVRFSPINVPNSASIRAGVTFAAPTTASIESYHFSNATEPAPHLAGLVTGTSSVSPRPGLAIVVGSDPSLGLVLLVSNPAPGGTESVVLDRLEWTASSTELAQTDLEWGNAALEALPWQAAGGSLPASLAPGDPPLMFDIPDGSLPPAGWAYVRYQAGTPSSGADLDHEGVAMGPIESVTPARHRSWGALKALFR